MTVVAGEMSAGAVSAPVATARLRPDAEPVAARPAAVSTRECRVWAGGEAIPAAIAAAFVVGVPLRLLLPADTRYLLVIIVLASVSGVGVLARPDLLARPAVGLVRALAGFVTSVATPALAAGRYVKVHGHAHGATGSRLRRKIAKHEAGHAVAARALGGRVLSAVVYDGDRGGLVHARLPGEPQAAVTFLLAGQYAVNSSEGAGADNDAIRKVLREVPSKDRAQVKAHAKKHARRIVSSRSGEIRRDARTLDEKGRL
ncbi:hypothetical protein ACU61A_00715 [Pseudonocardia sichuanensis]